MMTITMGDYFGPWMNSPDVTSDRKVDALELLQKVNALLDEVRAAGIFIDINPRTNNCVSGLTYGGFRPQSCPEGAPRSSHREGMAVDVYDPKNLIDAWITDEKLEAHGLYREHPDCTPKWVHLSTRPPASRKRTFYP